MQDMRYANNGCCSLSKGTQSDGLVSDTSTEEFTSDSSTENLQESKVSEKVVAKENEEVCNEAQNLVHLESSISLHQMQTQCQLYIRWGVLFSFGTLLWVALWMTDILKPNPFLTEDVTTAKKVTLRAGLIKTTPPFTLWFFNLWGDTYSSIISVTTLDILVLLCCIIILVYLEARTENKWRGTIREFCRDQFCKSPSNIGTEQSHTDDTNFRFNILEEESPMKTSEIKNCNDDLSNFSHGDVKNVPMENKTNVKSKLLGKNTRYSNQGGTSAMENRIPRSLKASYNMNNTRKRSLHLDNTENYRKFSHRCNGTSQSVVISERILNKPNFDLSYISSISENNNTKASPEESNLTCSIFNESTSFMSKETWFELPNPDQAEKVMHSFDVELEEFFKTRSGSSPLSLQETTQDVERYNNNSFHCKCHARSKAVVSNVNYNGGIVSSSPAFQRFLINLTKDRLPEP